MNENSRPRRKSNGFPSQKEGVSKRLQLKRKLAGELLLTFLEVLSKHPGELTLDEIAIFSVIYNNQLAKKQTHSKMFPDSLGLSAASINRKLSKLLSEGYIIRELKDRVYYYSVPEAVMNQYYSYDDGKPLVDDLYEKIINVIAEMVES